MGGHLQEGHQCQSDDGQVQYQVELIAAGQVEKVPFVPVGGINLVGEQDGGVQQKKGLGQIGFHGISPLFLS